MEQQIIDILIKISWPGSVFGSVLIIYKSGLLEAFSSRILNKINGSSHEKRINKLENNDIKHIEQDITSIRNDISEIYKRINKHGEDIAVLKSKAT